MNHKLVLLILPIMLIGLVSSEGANASISQEGMFKKIIPSEFKVGDIQFAILVKNNYNYTLFNIVPVINGKGFSTYDIYPIESLEPGEKGYILVIGNFKESGNVTLYGKWISETFTQTVAIVNGEELARIQQTEIDNKIKEEILANLSMQLNSLKKDYAQLETDLSDKKDNDFDVSKINFDQARAYLRDAETYILSNDVGNAKIRIRLAAEEIGYQRITLNAAKQISSIAKFKEYALIFSTIAGAFITFFALSELLKRKGRDVVTTVHEVGSKFTRKK